MEGFLSNMVLNKNLFHNIYESGPGLNVVILDIVKGKGGLNELRF